MNSFYQFALDENVEVVCLECGDCSCFQPSKTNQNFGRCLNEDSVSVKTYFETQVPLVHKTDKHSCWKG